MHRKHRLILGIIVALVIVALFGVFLSGNLFGSPNAGMANPASTYCQEQGGKVDIRTAADGSQAGVCVFPNGSECDEWAFFRKECAPK